MTVRSWQTSFVGRRDELQTLETAFASTRAGNPSVVIIGGEAGVGKSRMLQQFIDTDHGRDAVVLTGGCRDSAGSPLPFGPIIEALRSLDEQSGDATRAERLVSVRNELAAVLPGLEQADLKRKTTTTSSGSRSQLFELILSLIEHVTETGPGIMVIEDMQWADRSTLDLIAFLVANFNSTRVMLLLTYRSDELLRGSNFLRYIAQLARNSGVIRMTVGPLAQHELMKHLDELSGEPLPDTFAGAIWERSQGNPFYAEELLASAEEGDSAALPANVGDVMLARLNELDDPTQVVLRAASAGGQIIDHTLLAAAVSELTEDQIEVALREALAHQILVTDKSGHTNFRHALLREATYGELLPAERRNVHARYAHELLRRSQNKKLASPSAAELAHHHYEAGEYGPALVASLDAALSAEEARGYAESHTHYERAIELWPQVDEIELPLGTDFVELLSKGAWVSHLEGDNQRSIELIRKALEVAEMGDPRIASLRVRLGSYLEDFGESAEGLAQHEAIARELSGAVASSTYAEVLCAYAQSLMSAGRHRQSVQQATEALTVAREVKDRVNEASALTILGSNLVLLGEPERGARNLEDALALAEKLGRPTEIATGYRHLALTLAGPLNRQEDAVAVSQRGLERVTELGLERHWGLTLRSIVMDSLFRIGRWDEAMAVLEVTIQRSARGASALDLLLARLKLTVGRGDFASADADFATIDANFSRALELRYVVPIATLRAGLALWRDDTETAVAAVNYGLANMGATDDVWFAAPLVWHGMRAQAERAEEARVTFNQEELADAISVGVELRTLSEKMCASGRQQGALRVVVDAYDVMCEGELLRIKGESAPDLWSAVTSAWDELGQPYPAAYARWRWAEALLAQPHGGAKAKPLLREAHDAAVAMGAVPMVEHLEAIADRALIELAPEIDLADGADTIDVRETVLARVSREVGLTPREAQVLTLVAEGKTNRGIAEELFVSEKTASVHVSNILMKLGVKSRVQASTFLHRARAALEDSSS